MPPWPGPSLDRGPHASGFGDRAGVPSGGDIALKGGVAPQFASCTAETTQTPGSSLIYIVFSLSSGAT